MNGAQRAALAALLVAIAALLAAGIRGELRVGLFLIVPFLIGTGPYSLVGFLALGAAMVLGFLGAARRAHEGFGARAPNLGAAEPRSRSGGVVLLGPIPIVWGSDRRVLPWMVALGLLLLVATVLLSSSLR